jgi:hypothetical protein
MLEIKNGFYRYEASYRTEHPELFLRTYPLLRPTPKGYWISVEGVPRWVSSDTRKRFAYPTKREALIAFIKRTERRVKIIKGTLLLCSVTLQRAEEKLHENVW